MAPVTLKSRTISVRWASVSIASEIGVEIDGRLIVDHIGDDRLGALARVTPHTLHAFVEQGILGHDDFFEIDVVIIGADHVFEIIKPVSVTRRPATVFDRRVVRPIHMGVKDGGGRLGRFIVVDHLQLDDIQAVDQHDSSGPKSPVL
jgi:hypothetical protein